MTRILSSELLKMRTTRTFYGLVVGGTGMVLVIVVLVSGLVKFSPGDEPLRALMGVAGFVQAFALILGILVVTSEFRHGTITPSLLAVPQRTRLVLAKLAAGLIAGLVLGAISMGLVALIVSGFASLRDFDDGATGSATVRMVIGGTLATALSAALGVGLGALVRNQVGAVVGALVYSFVLEPLTNLVPGVRDVVPEYGIGGTGAALSFTGGGDRDVLAQVPGGLLFAAYAAVFVVAGILVMRRRDVTA